MFDSIIRVCKNTKKLSPNKILKKVFDLPDIELDIVKMNVEQMYNDGVDSRGNSLGEYSAVTKKIKAKKNQRTDHVTLRDTREFHNSVEVRSQSNKVVIKADMNKSGTDLKQRYPFALGLTDENKKALQSLISPLVREITLENILA